MINFDIVWELSLRDTDIAEHLLILYGLAVSSKAKTIMEIGAGQSTYVLTAVANENQGEFYSIDLTKEARERLFPHAPNLDAESRYHFIKGNSMEIAWNQPIEFLFIDSGHTYALTYAELIKYTPFVKSGSFICLHDTGERNNIFIECRQAMLDFLQKTNWSFRTMNNQNGLTIIRKT